MSGFLLCKLLRSRFVELVLITFLTAVDLLDPPAFVFRFSRKL